MHQPTDINSPTFAADLGALKRIVAGIVAMIELALNGSTLPRSAHRAALRLLRPAESAARRLILALACQIEAKAPKYRPKPPSTAGGRPAERRRWITLDGLRQLIVVKPGQRLPVGAVLDNGRIIKPPALPRFSLLDAFSHPRPMKPKRRRLAGRPEPRIIVLDWDGPFLLFPMPVAAPRQARTVRRLRPGDERLDATRLSSRLGALCRALEDLPGQARRLARWQARQARDEALMDDGKMSFKYARRIRPVLHPGYPPGMVSRRAPERRQREIDGVVWRADEAARAAQDLREFRLNAAAALDTS